MTIKTILTEPNKLLRLISEPVLEGGEVERKIINHLQIIGDWKLIRRKND